MRKLGITRPIDKMGRVVIPREIRRSLNLEHQDRLEVFIDGDSVIFRKSGARCLVCGSINQLTQDGKVCMRCLKKYKNELTT